MPKSTSHPGVTLVRRGTRWRARWRDPDSEQYVWLTLNPALATERARLAWAKDKSREIGFREMALARGAAPKAKSGSLADAIKAYFTANEERLRPRTAKLYRTATQALLGFGEDPVTKSSLLGFRQQLTDQRKRVQKAGGERFEYQPTKAPRSAQTINAHLRACASVLEWCRFNGHVAIAKDDITDGLSRVRVEDRELPRPIPKERIRDLVKAVQKHEAHAASFVVFVLLTGMRYSEARLLAWVRVDLANKQIVLTPAETKTARGRRVDLECSPSVIALLEALPKNGTRVFNLTDKEATNARQRLAKRVSWDWTYQELRQTCASYLCSAPWYGPFKSAKRLGHSTAIADRLYADSVTIDPNARTLEAAIGIVDLLASA